MASDRKWIAWAKPITIVSLSVLALLAAYLFVFSKTPKPDLIVTNTAGTCERDKTNPKMLKIGVKNNAPTNITITTRTTIEFSVKNISGGFTSKVPYSHTLPSFSANQTTDVLFPLPTPCIQGPSSGYTCSYIVTVDVDKAIDEANENNNIFSGNCP